MADQFDPPSHVTTTNNDDEILLSLLLSDHSDLSDHLQTLPSKYPFNERWWSTLLRHAESAGFLAVISTNVVTSHDQTYNVLKDSAQLSNRMRILTECLRSSRDDVAPVLNEVDSTLVLNGSKRGLFRVLLGVAAGPVGDSDQSWNFVRRDALEALSVLMYDRLEGGITRLDFVLLLNGAEMCGLEFGMGPVEYMQRTSGTILRGRSSVVDKLGNLNLNGLWALLLAECMGLWRIHSGPSWVEDHPLLIGLNLSRELLRIRHNGEGNDTPNSELNGRALANTLNDQENDADNDKSQPRNELEMVYSKLLSLGETLSKRRTCAYKNRHATANDHDDELWGVEAVEGVALLSFGLLLQSAAKSIDHEKFREWGDRCSQTANDECAAFAYLYRVLDRVVDDPVRNAKRSISSRRDGDEGGDIIRLLAGRREIEGLAVDSLDLLDERSDRAAGVEISAADPASVVYASVGREIVSATIYVFRPSLLTLRSESAIENVGMLSDLASVIYRNSAPLCDQFWADWQVLNDAMREDWSKDEGDGMCFLLDMAHSLAESTLEKLNNGEFRDSIIKYLRPCSAFLQFIASLCSSSSVVQSVFSCGFFPDGLISNIISLCSALAPLLSSLNDSPDQIASDDRTTIRCAAQALDAISSLVYLGGTGTVEWVRKSAGTRQPRALFSIASHAIARKHSILSGECVGLTMGALDLFAELLVGADVPFLCEASGCFTPSDTFGNRSTSGFARFLSGGTYSPVTLSAISIVHRLAVNLTRISFDSTIVDPGTIISSYIQTLGAAVISGLDLLSSLFSNGEVIVPFSPCQLDVVHSIMLSTVVTLVDVRPVLYLHKDDNVRIVAMGVRNDILRTLATSTALGHVIASLATSEVLSRLAKTSPTSHHSPDFMQSPRVHDQNSIERSKYGEWERFVTPKRASQKTSQREAERNRLKSDVGSKIGTTNDTSLFFSTVTEAALSLLLVWADNAEDAFVESSDESHENFYILSPCNLLLSKAAFSSLQKDSSLLNVSNLNLISRLVTVEQSHLSSSAVLSAKIIKVCLRHASIISRSNGISFDSSPKAYADEDVLSRTLSVTLKKLPDEDFAELEQPSILSVIILEIIAISIGNEPRLARAILIGEQPTGEFELIEALVSSLKSTVSSIESINRNETVDRRLMRLRFMVASGCLGLISKLWTSCRLICHDDSLSDCHVCGSILRNLVTDDGVNPSITNILVQLSQCSLLAIVSQEESNSMQDEVLVEFIHEKSILLDMLSRSLDIMSIENVARMKSNIQTSIDFILELTEAGPLECWSFLVAANNSSTLASSLWKECNSASWNIREFIKACPPEKSCCTTVWCSPSLVDRLTRARDKTSKYTRCCALNVLSMAESEFLASWAQCFEVIALNFSAVRPEKCIQNLTDSLIDGVLSSMSSISQSRVRSRSLLSNQEFCHDRQGKPLHELCSLLVTSLTNKCRLEKSHKSPEKSRKMLELLSNLYESSSRLLLFSHFDATFTANSMIRQKLQTSALLLLSELEPEAFSRDEVVKYNEIRLGWMDITLDSLLTLNLEQGEGAQTAKLYNFDITNNDEIVQHDNAAFQLLRVCVSFLSSLTPSGIGTKSELSGYLFNSYAVDLAASMKQRNAMGILQFHLSKASTIASLTYQSVYDGTANQVVTANHHNAVTIIDRITVFILKLTGSASTCIDIFHMLLESRCFRSLTMTLAPLLTLANKSWASTEKNLVQHVVGRNRGYISSPSLQNKVRNDLVHSIWSRTVAIFSSLLRSSRLQSEIYTKIDEKMQTHLLSVSSVVFDFITSFEDAIFSSLFSISTKPKGIGDQEKKNSKTSSSLFASTISSSSFSFTSNLLQEVASVLTLFEQCCKGDFKNKFAESFAGIYNKMIASSLDLLRMLSSFLGAIANARELFHALSCANAVSFDQTQQMFDSHPLLVDGLPNARHESIRNSHFASSCCNIVTSEEFSKSRVSTTSKSSLLKGEPSSDTFEQTFQIQVNNEFIVEVEKVAGQCLYSVLSVLTDAHPFSDRYVSFSMETISNLDVAALITPGSFVAFVPQNTGMYSVGRYGLFQSKPIQYGQAISCDRSTRTLYAELHDCNEVVEKQIPWSWIVGMEDSSKRRCLLSHNEAPKSISDADTKISASTGHLILALRWCRHISKNNDLASLGKRISDRAATLLTTEIVLHDELTGGVSAERKLNSQLLDLFDSARGSGTGEWNPSTKVHKILLDNNTLNYIHTRLRKRLQAARVEREEELKLWEQQNSSWDNTSFWGGGIKREGRRSPFRVFTRMSSSESIH